MKNDRRKKGGRFLTPKMFKDLDAFFCDDQPEVVVPAEIRLKKWRQISKNGKKSGKPQRRKFWRKSRAYTPTPTEKEHNCSENSSPNLRTGSPPLSHQKTHFSTLDFFGTC